jgi:hypothetical protein
MKKLICTLFLATAVLRFAGAADTPESEGDKSAATPEALPIELKNKSSFVMDESGRNPFWPIGWKPVAKKTNEHVGPEIRESAFLVSSITMEARGRYAIINGKVMTEGQVFGLQFGNQTYQITVKFIQDGQVVLQRRDQELVIPLRRR